MIFYVYDSNYEYNELSRTDCMVDKFAYMIVIIIINIISFFTMNK